MDSYTAWILDDNLISHYRIFNPCTLHNVQLYIIVQPTPWAIKLYTIWQADTIKSMFVYVRTMYILHKNIIHALTFPHLSFFFLFPFSLHATQITIDGFSIGRFCSYVLDGCPDGYLQISEAARTSVGGMWCGSIEDGPVVFYSETRTLILTLKVQR